MADPFKQQVDELQTPSDTQTTISTYTVPDNYSSGAIIGLVTAKKPSDIEYGGMVQIFFVRTTDGNVTCSSTIVDWSSSGPKEGAIACDASGNDVRVRVTGDTGETWEWVSALEIYN